MTIASDIDRDSGVILAYGGVCELTVLVRYFLFHYNYTDLNFANIFIDALRPSQQLWSRRDVVSILLDFYPKLDVMTSRKCFKYNHPSKTQRRKCVDSLT